MDLGRNNTIVDTKLLALINNDVFIKGTRNLEGAEFERTISYLKHFMSDRKNAPLIENIFNSKEERNELMALMNRMNSLEQTSQEINNIIKNLGNVSGRFGGAYKNEEEIERTINSGAQPFVSRLMKLNKSTDSYPSSVLMPGGWLGAPGKSGHAIAYEFKKDKNGDYIFLVYNSGAGLQFHENVTSADKDRYKTVKAYKIPGTATEAELNYFVSELIKPNTLPIIQGRDPSKVVEYSSKILYEEVFRKISYLKGEEIPLQEAELRKGVQELASVGQRSGTCAEKVLHELMKLNITDKKKAKALVFFFKLFSIEEFVDQHQTSMDGKKTSQLKWASQNLSKLLLNQKDSLPDFIQLRATEALEKAKILLEKSKQELTQSQTLNALDNLSQNQVMFENINLNKTPAIAVVQSPKKIIEQPFNLNKIDFASNVISTRVLDLEKLKTFKILMDALEFQGFYKDAEQALFDYFTQAPLDKNYFSSIKNPAEAIEYVELTNYLAAKYISVGRKAGTSLDNPKKTAVRLNVAESLDLLYQIDVVKVVDSSGFDSLTSSKNGLNDFKRSRHNNAYLSTDIPEVDERTKKIMGRQSYASSLDFDAFMDYINKSPQFKNYLISLFDKNRSPDIFDDELKNFIKAKAGTSYYSGFKNYNRTESDRKAIAAYFRYFNENECGIYKEELDKLKLFKKMKVCVNQVFSESAILNVDISNETIFNPIKSIGYFSKVMEYNEGIDTTTNLSFSIDNNLNQYFNKIGDHHNEKPLGLDAKTTKDAHTTTYKDNEIFFYPEGEKVEGDQVQTPDGRLHQELMHLRTAPDLQIMTTIDYFKDKLYLFANKITEGENENKIEKDNVLKNDMQQYIRRNLFQPGLLLKEFNRNPESYDVIQDNFVNKGILYFTKNKKINNETLYFYDLQQDICKYALKSTGISSDKKKSIFSDMAAVYKELKEINQGELNQAERYELSKVKLKMQLTLLDNLKDVLPFLAPNKREEHYKNLFEAYMEFSANSRDVALDFPEQRDQLKQLKYACIEMLKIDSIKDKTFEWTLQYIKENGLANQAEWEEIEKASSQQKIIKFPYFYVKNNLGEELVAVDMLEGLVLIKGNYFCYPPDKLVNSPIYKLVCGEDYPRMSVSIMNKVGDWSSENVKTYQVMNSEKITGRFVDAGRHAKAPFVYQQFMSFDNQTRYCEKRVLSNNHSNLSLMVRPKQNLSLDISLNLPESFYSNETDCWLACDANTIYIEKMNGKYIVNFHPSGQIGTIQELDDNKKSTGFILSTDYEDPKVKSVLEVFKGFEDPKFTEILFKPTNNVNKNVEELKIKLPRYNLELEGKFDSQEQKWNIYQKSNPDLVLVHDANIQIKPKIDISNSLVFEDKKTKQRFLYTPVQNYYVEIDEKRNENISDTVYYQPKIDTKNISKRMLQGKVSVSSTSARPRLGLSANILRAPEGAATYSNSEEFRVFPIDSNTQELKTATTEDKLHLAYLDLINLQPEEALSSIRSIIKMGGLKGTTKELDLIEKIFNRTPLDASSLEVNRDLRIDSPEFVAVRTHILYLISDLYANKKTFSLPDLNKKEVNSPDDFLEKEQLKTLQSFETSIPELMHEHLNKSLNIYSATPKEMRLPKALEYKMIPRLENGYSLGLLEVPSSDQVQMLSQYITDPPVLFRAKSPSLGNQTPEYWLIGKDRYGRNKLTKINSIDLMNSLQFSTDIEKIKTVYISEEKNRNLFLEIESRDAHIYQAKTVPIQARHEHLKNWYRTRELAKIDKQKEDNEARIKQLEQKTKRAKKTDTYEKRVETKTIQFPLMSILKIREFSPPEAEDYTEFKVTSSELYPNIRGDINKIIAKGDPNNPQQLTWNINDLHPNMSDEQFLERIIPIIALAKSTESRRNIERDKLKDFLENTLKANCKIRPEKQNSLIRNWAPSILAAIRSPSNFSHIELKREYEKKFYRDEYNYSNRNWNKVLKTIIGNPNRHEDFVKSFLAQASLVNTTYPVQIKDYQYYLKENLDITSKQFKTEKYVPQLIDIKPSTAYQNILHEDFINTSGLQAFYQGVQEVKQNTENEVDKLKIQLDMEIRESLIKQQVELLEAEIKDKKYKNSSDIDLLTLEEQLKLKREECQADEKNIEQIKQQLRENLGKDLTPDLLMEREELTKKYKAITKESRYQDTAEIKRQYDEKIGAMRNNEGEKIYQVSQKMLADDQIRNNANDTCTKFISIIDPRVTAFEKSLLILMNKGPTDPEAQKKYQRELQSRKREPLTMADLNRLFVLADINEYKRVTGLDEQDIHVLHNQMAEYINLNVLKQQYNRIQSILNKTDISFFSDPNKINEVTQLGRTIATINMVAATGHADILFFQKEEDILITPLQDFYLDKLLNKNKETALFNNEVIQLIMGGGKSKVLGPLSMLKKADGTNLAIFQVKDSLLETNFADMNATSRRLFNQEAVLFKFERNSPCSSKDLKALYHTFHKTSINKGYIVTSGNSLKSLELKYLETLEDMPENTSPRNAEFIEWNKKIKWFERSLNFLETKGDRLIDEVHDELDPNKELNYTLGDAVPPSKEDIKLIIDVFYFLREVPIGKAELGIDREIKAFDLIHNNKSISDPKIQMPKIMDKIASDFVNNLNTVNPNPLAKIIAKLDLKQDSEKEALKEYLLNKNPKFFPILKSKLNEKELSDIAFVKSELSKFLPVTLLKNYNENYGPSRIEGLTQIKRKLAIPYTDLNTPNEKSRFGEFTESMNYTVQMNIIEPISTELVTELIKEYIEKAQTEQVDSLDAKFDNTSASIEYNAKFEKITKPTLEQISNYLYDENGKAIGDPKIISTLFFEGNPTSDELEEFIVKVQEEQNNILSLSGKLIKISETEASKKFDLAHRLNKEPAIIKLEKISAFNKKNFDCLVCILKDSEDFKKVVLSDYVLKQVENNPVVLTSNSQDSGGMTRTTQAMSGTPHNAKSYHKKIYFDESQGLGTDGETISLLKNKKTPVVDSSAYESVIGLLTEYLDNPTVDEEVRRNSRAIIDAGALFKKEKSNFGIAKQIGQYCNDNPDKFSSEIKYVLYFENQGDILHAWDIKNNKKIKLGTSDEKEISKILNCKPEERFTVYDQARITGTDIVQASGANEVDDPKTGKKITFSANAIMTFSEKTTKSAFLQAVKRMRQFHNKQTVSIIKADYLKERLPKDNDIDEVLAFVNQVQVDKALQLHFKSTGHKFKNALRSDFMDKIRNQEKDPVRKHEMLDVFKPIFHKTYQPNHFLNHGAVETDQDAILYFPIMAEKYYDQWEKLLDEAGIEATELEKIEMKKALDSLANEAVDICEKTFKGKSIERVGAEMAQDDNLGNEVENELQNELEIQIQKELELEKEILTFDKNRQKFNARNYQLPDGANLLMAQDPLFSVCKQVITQVPFDDNIFMTSHQRQTVSGNFSNYYDQHIKPFHVVMMVAQKNQPETLQCVILTKEEAQEHISRNQVYRNKDVWFVSCHDTVLYGKKPTWLKPDDEDTEPKAEDLAKYNRALEQIRYINGDLNAIVQQKHGLTWLSENAQTKLDFINNNIIKRFPEANKYYRNLKSRLDVTSKIFNYMQNHPFENYLDDQYDWNKVSKGFSDTADPESLAKIKVFAQALNDVNTIYENNYRDNKLSKLEIEKTYDQQIAYRLNQHKTSFLDKRTKIIEALSTSKPLDFVLSSEYKDIDLNFLVNKQTVFEVALNNNSVANLEELFTKNKIKWTQKNGASSPVTNAELVVLHAIKKLNEGKTINDSLLDIIGGKLKNSDKVSKLAISTNSDENLLILAVKHNSLPLLQCIEEEYLSSYTEKDLKDILQSAQKHLTTESLPEIKKLIQTQGKDGDLIEKHKRLRTVVFDKINTWVESDYNSKSKLDFSKRPFSVAKVDFGSFTPEDKDFIKSVIDKIIINPNLSVLEFLHKKETLKQDKMFDKNTALTDVLTHSENLLDSDLNKIMTIFVQNQAEVKFGFALALENGKSKSVLSHLKNQNGVNIYYDPDKPEAKKQFLLLRNYKKDTTEEIVRKINICHEMNADFNTMLDYKGNAIIHNLCFLEKDQQKLKQIIPVLCSSLTFDLNAKNQHDQTALHMAIASENVAMVKLLLKQKDNKKQDKVDIDIQNASGKTAMDLVVDALQKDESFNPEIVSLITDAYKRKHENDYLKDIAVESMLSEEIWTYLNEKHSIKEGAFKDKTLVSRIIHANSRNETEFNIHKSEFYKRLNSNMDDKFSVNFIQCIDLYDGIQFDKNLIGREQKIDDFDAPKLAEIKKEKIDKFPDKWPRSDLIAIQALREFNNNLFAQDEQASVPQDLRLTMLLNTTLDKHAKTIEEYYDAKKEFISYIKKQIELPADEAIFSKKEAGKILDSISNNPHKLFPSYKAAEPDKTTQVKLPEGSAEGAVPAQEKDWSRMAHGYLADIIGSGTYLNRYQDIPFNDFMSGNATTQEEFDKLKAETKKYLNLIFQDSMREKEVVIGAIDKVNFKSKTEEKITSPSNSNLEQPQIVSPESIAEKLFDKIQTLPSGFDNSNLSVITEYVHEAVKDETNFNEVRNALRELVGKKELSNLARIRRMILGINWDQTLPQKIINKREAEALAKENEAKKLEASANQKSEDSNLESNKTDQASIKPQEILEKSSQNIKLTKQFEKNYTVIAKEMFNFAIPFTKNYEKPFNSAYKIKLKEYAKTTEDFDEINSELKVLFKKHLLPEQSKIATGMLNAVKATDLGLKASAHKAEAKIGSKAPITTPQTSQQVRPSVITTVVTPPVQPITSTSVPVSNPITQPSQPQGVTKPVTSPIVTPQPVIPAANLIAQLEDYLPNQFDQMQQLDKQMQAELKRLALLNDASPEETKDLHNARLIIKSFMKYKELIDEEPKLMQMSQIPQELIKDLFSRAEKAIQQSEKDDFGFAYGYVNRARNILTTKIEPSLIKLKTLLKSSKPLKDEDINLYTLYFNDLEILYGDYERLEDFEEKHKLFEKTKVTYSEHGKNSTKSLLSLVNHHHTRVTEIEELTSEACNLIANISKTDREKLFPNKLNTFTHFEVLMTLLKDKSAISASKGRKRQEVYALVEQPTPSSVSVPVSTPIVQPTSSVIPEQQEINLANQQKAFGLLKDLEPLTNEMKAIQQNLQQARNIHDFTIYFGEQYQKLLIPLDNKYKLSSILGEKLETVCEEVLKNPLSQLAENKQDIGNMIAAVKSSGNNIVQEINLNLSELLIRSWTFAKQLPPEQNEQENIILLLKDNVLAAGGCLPGIGARLVSAYSSCLRASLDSELYNTLHAISFEDVDADQKSRKLTDSALVYINQKTNNLDEKPLKGQIKNPKFEVDLAFINSLLHAHSHSSDEFYKNKLILLKTIYQKYSPSNPKYREQFDTLKTMMDMVVMDNNQLGKANLPSDFVLIKTPDIQPSSIPTVVVPQIPQKLSTAPELLAQIEGFVPDQLENIRKLNSEMYQELKNLTILEKSPENQASLQELKKHGEDLKNARKILEPFMKYKELIDTEQALSDRFNRIPETFIQDLEARIQAENNQAVKKDLIFAKQYIQRAKDLPSKINLALPQLTKLLNSNQTVALSSLQEYVQYMTELETLAAENSIFQSIVKMHDFSKYTVPDGEFNGLPKTLTLLDLTSPCFQRIMRVKDLTSETCNLIANATRIKELKSFPKTESFFIHFSKNMEQLKDQSADAALKANEREVALAYDGIVEKIKGVDIKDWIPIEMISEYEQSYSDLTKKGKKPVIDGATYDRLNNSLQHVLSADASWGSWLSAGKTALKSNLIGLSNTEKIQEKNKKSQLELYKKLETTFEKIGKKLKTETEQQEKNDLIKDYNTHVVDIEELLDDVSTLQYLEKRVSYKKFNTILTSAEQFYENNKASTFFADDQKINLQQKIKDLTLARTNVLTSLISDIEDNIVAKLTNSQPSYLQAKKSEFEKILSDLNDPELIYAVFEQSEKEKLITKIKDKIQDLEKLITPVTPPVNPQPGASSTSTMALNFDLALHCKASAWHNNCALNCLTHYIYSKLESNGIQTHFNNDPAYNLLRESFKEYYNLATMPTWDQIKAILDEYPVAHDREAVLAPAFRVYLSKIMIKEKDAIWNTEATAAISDYLVTGHVSDVAQTIFNVNKTEIIELKKQFDAEIRAINPVSFTTQEKEKAKQKIEDWNKHPDIKIGARKIKDPNSTAVINAQIFAEKRILIEDKYSNKAYKQWNDKDGFCEKYAKHMANMTNGELVSVNQLGLIATELGIGLEVFTTTHRYNLGADVRPQASKDWVLKVYNPSQIHWEYEEPTQSKAKTIQHNNDYTNSENGVFRTLSNFNKMSDNEIKQTVVQKWTEKGFSVVPSVQPVQPQPTPVQPVQPTTSPSVFDAHVVADEIYHEAKQLTQDFTLNVTNMFRGKINAKVSNETEFNAVKQALPEVLKTYLELDQDPTKLNFAIQLLGDPQYIPKISLQPSVPSGQPTTPSVVVTQTPSQQPVVIFPSPLIAQEIINQVMAESNNFKDKNSYDQLQAMFAERINLYATNRSEFDKIVMGLSGLITDFETGRIYFTLKQHGLEEKIIKQVKKAADDTAFIKFTGTEEERKQQKEKLRINYQSSVSAKTLFDAKVMSDTILTLARLQTNGFKQTILPDIFSDYLNEYLYTQSEFDAVMTDLLGTSSKRGRIDNELGFRKQEDIDAATKGKELFKQINYKSRAPIVTPPQSSISIGHSSQTVAKSIAEHILSIVMLETKNLTERNISQTIFSDKINLYAKNKSEFEQIANILIGNEADEEGLIDKELKKVIVNISETDIQKSKDLIKGDLYKPFSGDELARTKAKNNLTKSLLNNAEFQKSRSKYHFIAKSVLKQLMNETNNFGDANLTEEKVLDKISIYARNETEFNEFRDELYGSGKTPIGLIQILLHENPKAIKKAVGLVIDSKYENRKKDYTWNAILIAQEIINQTMAETDNFTQPLSSKSIADKINVYARNEGEYNRIITRLMGDTSSPGMIETTLTEKNIDNLRITDFKQIVKANMYTIFPKDETARKAKINQYRESYHNSPLAKNLFNPEQIAYVILVNAENQTDDFENEMTTPSIFSDKLNEYTYNQSEFDAVMETLLGTLHKKGIIDKEYNPTKPKKAIIGNKIKELLSHVTYQKRVTTSTPIPPSQVTQPQQSSSAVTPSLGTTGASTIPKLSEPEAVFTAEQVMMLAQSKTRDFKTEVTPNIFSTEINKRAKNEAQFNQIKEALAGKNGPQSGVIYDTPNLNITMIQAAQALLSKATYQSSATASVSPQSTVNVQSTQPVPIVSNPTPVQQPATVVTQPKVTTPQQPGVLPTQPLPTQPGSVGSSTIPVQQQPSSIINQQPQGTLPQLGATGAQATQSTPPVQTTPQQPAVGSTQPSIPPTQSGSAGSTMPVQQPSLTVNQQPQGTLPQQGATGAQATQSTPPVSQQTAKPAQGFLPGFSVQSGSTTHLTKGASIELKTPEEIAEVLFSEIIQKIPDGFDNKNSATISNLIYLNSGSEAEFNEVRNALRECVSKHDVPRVAAVRRMLHGIEYSSAALNSVKQATSVSTPNQVTVQQPSIVTQAPMTVPQQQNVTANQATQSTVPIQTQPKPAVPPTQPSVSPTQPVPVNTPTMQQPSPIVAQPSVTVPQQNATANQATQGAPLVQTPSKTVVVSTQPSVPPTQSVPVNIPTIQQPSSIVTQPPVTVPQQQNTTANQATQGTPPVQTPPKTVVVSAQPSVPPTHSNPVSVQPTQAFVPGFSAQSGSSAQSMGTSIEPKTPEEIAEVLFSDIMQKIPDSFDNKNSAAISNLIHQSSSSIDEFNAVRNALRECVVKHEVPRVTAVRRMLLSIDCNSAALNPAAKVKRLGF